MDNPLEGHSNRYDAASVASMFQTGVFPDGYGSSSSEDDYFDLSDPEATADDPNAGSSVEESPVSDMVAQPSPSSDEESPVSPMVTQFTPPIFDSPSQSPSSPPPSRSSSQSQPPSPPQSPRGTPMTRLCGRLQQVTIFIKNITRFTVYVPDHSSAIHNTFSSYMIRFFLFKKF